MIVFVRRLQHGLLHGEEMGNTQLRTKEERLAQDRDYCSWLGFNEKTQDFQSQDSYVWPGLQYLDAIYTVSVESV